MIEGAVVLVHAAGLDHHNWSIPNKQGQLHVQAAAALLSSGEASCVLYAGGEYRRGKRPMSDAMRERTIQLAPNTNPHNVISIPEAVTTRQEIRIFRDEAKKRGWSNLLDVSIAAQLVRIKRRLLVEFGREIPTQSVEEILGLEVPNQSGIASREAFLARVDSSPVGSALDRIARMISSKCYLEELLTERLEQLKTNR